MNHTAPYSWYRFITLAIVVAVASPAYSAETPTVNDSALRKTWIDLKFERLEAEAELEVLTREKTLLGKGTRDRDEPPALEASVHGFLMEPMERLLKRTESERQKALDRTTRNIDKEHQEAVASWRKAEEARFQFVNEIAATEARLGPLWDVSTPPLLGDRILLLVFAWGMFLFACGILLAAHTMRQHIRRRLRARDMGAVVVLFVCVLPIHGCAPLPDVNHESAGLDRLAQEKDRLEGECGRMRNEIKTLREKIGPLQTEVNKLHGDILRAKVRWLSLSAGPKLNSLGEFFMSSEETAGKELQGILCKSRLLDKLADDEAKTVDVLRKDRDKLSTNISGQHARSLILGQVRIGACVGFLGLALAPVWYARKKVNRQLARDAVQCPRCLASPSNGGSRLEVKRASSPDPRYPEPHYMHCPSCDYEFRQSYLKVPRLCFPTVGIRASGKTHWLVTAYHMVKNNNVPVEAAFQRAPSLADERFDKIMEMVLESHLGPGATPHQQTMIPDPVNLHVQDLDRWSPSSGLLNLFDFSGEVMFDHIDAGLLRRRALLMDGFIFFLDPCQVRGSDGDLSIEDQIRALTNFHQEMRDMRGLDLADKIDVPVAVCVSKLDLLINKNPFSTQAVPWIRALRSTMSDHVSLKTIWRRSRMCEQALPVMFPGWNIARALKENFGGHFMFFPMTPVSLDENQLGVEDLRQRTFSPFGVFEPILWLLHMHGYRVFQ